MKQAQLMSKFATIEPEKHQLDDLGFAITPPEQPQDALLDLISKSKDIVPFLPLRPSKMPSRSSTLRKHSRGPKTK